MTKTELLEIIRNGENSGVEFKRDDVRPESLAKELVALLNLEGGYKHINGNGGLGEPGQLATNECQF